MFGMCNRCLDIVSKIGIIWSTWTTPAFINYQLWTNYKTFLSLKLFISLFWLVPLFWKSTEEWLYSFQSKSTFCSCLNVKELLARNRCDIWFLFFFLYLLFFSRTFTNHRTAGERGGHFFNNSSLPLSPVSQTLRY